MTIKERSIELRKELPDASWSELERILGVHRHTIQGYVDPEYKKQRQAKININLKQRIAKHKFILVQFLGGQCSECGYRDCLSALEFHHKDPANKSEGVTDLLTGKFETALQEAEKCVLLCGNCHQKHHEQEQNNLSPANTGVMGDGENTRLASVQTPAS